MTLPIASLVTAPLALSELVTSDLLRLLGVCISAAASCYAAWSARQTRQNTDEARRELRRRRRRVRHDDGPGVLLVDEPPAEPKD